MERESIWRREIPWPQLPSSLHRALANLWALSSIIFLLAPILVDDQGLWFINIVGFALAVAGVAYLRRHLGEKGAGASLGALFVTWFAVSLWWACMDEKSLGAGMFAVEVGAILIARRTWRSSQ